MKIDPTGPLRATQVRRTGRKTGNAASAEFSNHLEGEASDSVASNGATNLAGVSALLALQEVGGMPEERARAVRRGQHILDLLDEIRLGLLAGGIPRGDLEALAATVREQREKVCEGPLAEVLDEIELRAAVELAKYDR